MSDQMNHPDTASPDMLETPDKGNGVRRLNRLPMVIIGTLLIMVLMSFVYTGELRSTLKKAQAATTDQDKYRVSGVVAPPITKPSGPDVTLASSAPVYNMPGQLHPSSGMPESDAARQAREKKVAELDAAFKAETRIEKFSQNQMMNIDGSPRMPGMPSVNGLIPPTPPYAGEDGETSAPGVDQKQAQQRAFLEAADQKSTYLNQTRKAAISPYEIKAGFVIPGIMVSGANSTLPGLLIGQVRQNVYDTATGKYLLIPAGAKLMGTYDSSISGGQQRIFAAWNRIIFPDSSSVSLEGMPGADKSGIAGFEDQVDNHYVRTFGQAFMLSLFSAGIQLSQPRGAVSGTYNAQQIGAAAIGQQLGMLGMQIARRNLNMQPTLEIRPGFQFTIVVNKDMILPPWQGHPMAQQQVRAVQEEVEQAY